MTTARRLGLLLLLIACAPLIMALSGGPSGHAFQDLNNNGVQDPGEPGLVGWTIHLFDTATKELLQSMLTDGLRTWAAAYGRRVLLLHSGSRELHDLRGPAGRVDADRPASRPTTARGDAG